MSEKCKTNCDSLLSYAPRTLARQSKSLWRNRLARSAVNRKVGGSNPPRDEGNPFSSSFEFVLWGFHEP